MKANVVKAASAVVLGASLMMSAIAAPPGNDGDLVVRVYYGDLNIESAAGAKVLYGRIQKAIGQACGLDEADTMRTISHRIDAQACYEKELGEALSKIDSAALKEIHTG